MLQNLSDTHLFLIFLVILIVVVFAVVSVYLVFQKRRGRVYKAKGPYLLSPGEKKLFDALENVVYEGQYVCPKVRIADIVEVDIPKESREFWRNFGKISQKHVDFLICNKNDFSPLLVIELDGGSHNNKARYFRDEFVNKVFADANIPILHIKAKGFYDYKELRGEINGAVKAKTIGH
jgi:hypothetical protein